MPKNLPRACLQERSLIGKKFFTSSSSSFLSSTFCIRRRISASINNFLGAWGVGNQHTHIEPKNFLRKGSWNIRRNLIRTSTSQFLTSCHSAHHSYRISTMSRERERELFCRVFARQFPCSNWRGFGSRKKCPWITIPSVINQDSKKLGSRGQVLC